jgi:hypothetical protein
MCSLCYFEFNYFVSTFTLYKNKYFRLECEFFSFFFLVKGPAALRLIVQPCDEDDYSFFVFPSNGAPAE